MPMVLAEPFARSGEFPVKGSGLFKLKEYPRWTVHEQVLDASFKNQFLFIIQKRQEFENTKVKTNRGSRFWMKKPDGSAVPGRRGSKREGVLQ